MDEKWPKDEVATADEKTTLIAFLGHQRRFLERKATGITDEQARTATCPPSNLTMLGLVRHLSDVERGWAKRGFAGQDAPPLYYNDERPEGDFDQLEDMTMAEALDVFWQEVSDAEEIYRTHDLEEVEHHSRSFYSLRWILVHLIEEYARHLGHADLIRQAIDGQTGE